MKRRTSTSLVALSPWCLLLACSSPAPPYGDLTLRDALGADPAVVAALPVEEQATIADHFEQQRAAEVDQESVPLEGPATPQEVLRGIDDARRVSGDDALVVARLSARGGALGIEASPGSAVDPDGPIVLPPLEGAPATDTREAETRALEGRAGRIVGEAMHASGGRRLVRVTQWPMAVVAVDGITYVNASWLVVMASLEHGDAGKSWHVLLGAPVSPPVTMTPLSLHGSPFATYPTLAACVADVTSRCEACLTGGACDSSTSLTDFSSSQSECAFLVNDGGSQQSIEELCILALTSIATVTQCVEADGCTAPPSNENTVAGLANAAPFLSNDTCVRSLDLCLSGQNEPVDGGTSGATVAPQVNGCLGPFQACSSMFEALGDACSKDRCAGKGGGGPSCGSCSGCTTCSSCSSDTRTGKGTGYGSVGTGQNPNQGGSTSSGGGGTGSSGGSGGSGSGGSGSGGSSGGEGSSGGASGGGSTSGSGGGGGTSGGGTSSTGGSSGGGGSTGCTGGGGSGAGASSCTTCSGCSGCSGSSSGSSSSGSSSGGCQGCGGSSSSGGGGGGSNCNQCRTVTVSAPSEPPVSVLWLTLPVLYLGRAARRRTGRRP